MGRSHAYASRAKAGLCGLRADCAGLTRIEALVVAAIVVIAVAVAVPLGSDFLHKAQDDREISYARSLYADLQADYLDNAYASVYTGSVAPTESSRGAGVSGNVVRFSSGETGSIVNGAITTRFTEGGGWTVTWTPDYGCRFSEQTVYDYSMDSAGY